MRSILSRRSFTNGIAAGSVVALAPKSSSAAENTWKRGPGMPSEGPNTPKIGAPVNGRDLSDHAMRAIKQLGVEYVLMGGGPIPWTVEQLTPMMDKLKAGGLKLGN